MKRLSAGIGILLLLFPLMALTGCKHELTPVTITPTPMTDDISPASGHIAFESDGEIRVMRVDGTDVKQLTVHDPQIDHNVNSQPAWSPDGKYIAFTSERDRHVWSSQNSSDVAGQVEFAAYVTGNNEQEINNRRPGLSVSQWNREIYVMKADGSEQTRLTYNEGDDEDPSWSPDGTQIAFSSWRDDKSGIFVMNTDGTEVKRLTSNKAVDRQPAWSPDGKYVAYTSVPMSGLLFRGPSDTESNIYLIKADGTGRTRLTRGGFNYEPAWSPDGKFIAFVFRHNYEPQIYTMRSDGRDVRLLTTVGVVSESPTWSPDGNYIAFSFWQAASPDMKPGLNLEIYIVRADGTGATRVTETRWSEYTPEWNPVE